MAIEKEKREVEQAIERARDGVSDHIDELDRTLRRSLDFNAMAAEHATGIVAGGAVIGFLAGFGFPKALRRAISIGIPLALIAMKVKKGRLGGGDGAAPDHEI
ncbi:MAG TPA: hypothetical protein VLV78_00675 [Thermoanaerobaculia bacterium]|nr:hypothetical protein [Thermoanaerobaculia bacterium]